MDGVSASTFSLGKVLVALDSADLSQIWPLLVNKEGIRLEYPGITLLNEKWQITSEVIDEFNSITPDLAADAAWFDLDALRDDLYFRPVTPGERIRPFGDWDFSQKVSDLFINSGVHCKARQRWPILYCGNDILWVTTVRRSRLAPVTAETKRVLVLTLQRK
jgi:tRNA(Ile)-lysidine synthetase-like protein